MFITNILYYYHFLNRKIIATFESSTDFKNVNNLKVLSFLNNHNFFQIKSLSKISQTFLKTFPKPVENYKTYLKSQNLLTADSGKIKREIKYFLISGGENQYTGTFK